MFVASIRIFNRNIAEMQLRFLLADGSQFHRLFSATMHGSQSFRLGKVMEVRSIHIYISIAKIENSIYQNHIMLSQICVKETRNKLLNFRK